MCAYILIIMDGKQSLGVYVLICTSGSLSFIEIWIITIAITSYQRCMEYICAKEFVGNDIVNITFTPLGSSPDCDNRLVGGDAAL